MKRPWEETWTYRPGKSTLSEDDVGSYRDTITTDDHDGTHRRIVRAGLGMSSGTTSPNFSRSQPEERLDPDTLRLMSAAPDMARELLAIEWGVRSRNGADRCPSCGGADPRFPELAEDGEDVGHGTDCPLDAALRKAGVR